MEDEILSETKFQFLRLAGLAQFFVCKLKSIRYRRHDHEISDRKKTWHDNTF